ncbi:MAG: IclR family transcriptional regulator [Pseudomonadota bacterium]
MDYQRTSLMGAQSLGRAILLLRLIARSGGAGATMAELAASAELRRPTAHRMLKLLVAEGMLEQEQRTRRYRMGPLVFELGLLAPSPTPLISACRSTLKRIAAETEDTVYLTLRSGIDGVCIDRVEASHAIRALTIDIGGRRPLGVGATGIALLAALPPDEAEAALMRNSADFKRYGRLTEQNVRENMEEARQSGFGYSVERITQGVSGIGIAIPNANGTPFVGISIASITARIVGDRQAFLEALLHREAATLATQLSHAFPLRTA